MMNRRASGSIHTMGEENSNEGELRLGWLYSYARKHVRGTKCMTRNCTHVCSDECQGCTHECSTECVTKNCTHVRSDECQGCTHECHTERIERCTHICTAECFKCIHQCGVECFHICIHICTAECNKCKHVVSKCIPRGCNRACEKSDLEAFTKVPVKSFQESSRGDSNTGLGFRFHTTSSMPPMVLLYMWGKS